MDTTGAVQATWDRLARTSGFPEPYVAGKESSNRRWAAVYHRQLIREDIRDMTDVKHVAAYNTVKSWLGTFERFHLTFSISPWTPEITRVIHKQRKTCLFDYAGIEEPAAKFENMVALELFRAIAGWNDLGLGDFGLHYIKTKEGREGNRKPLFLVETKPGDDTPAPNLLRFQKSLGIPAVQLLNTGDGFVRSSPAAYWLPRLP